MNDAIAPPTAIDEPPLVSASLRLRLASMVYEGLLLFGVVFIFSYVLLAVAHWTYPLTAYQRAIQQILLLAVIGWYFVLSWSKSGQTLPLKSWGLRVVGPNGSAPTTGRALARYVAALSLVLPAIVLVALFQTHSLFDLALFCLGFVLMLVPAAFDAQGRLLHDRLSGTRIVRVVEKTKPAQAAAT